MMEKNIQNEITLREFLFKVIEWLFYLKQKWIMILIFAVASGMVGYTYAYLKKTIFIGSLSFAMEDEKSNSGLNGALGLASQFGIDIGSNAGGVFSGSNLMEFMKSRTVVEKALLNKYVINGKETSLLAYYIQRYKLEKYEHNPSDKVIVMKLIKVDYSQRNQLTRNEDSVLLQIIESVKSAYTVQERDKKMSIIDVQVRSDDESFAKFFAESITDVTSDFYTETKIKKLKSNASILKHQVDSVREKLYESISGVAVQTDNTFNLNPAFNVKRVGSSKEQIDVQVNSAVFIELVKNLESTKFLLLKETPLIQIIDKPIFPLPQEKLSKKKMSLIGFVLGSIFAIIVLIFRRVINENSYLTKE